MQQLKTREAEMLEQIYKNVKMGADSILKVMPKVSDGKFKTDLTDQLNAYESVAARAKARLAELGCEAKEESAMVKLWASIGMTLNTLADSSDSHIAQMVAEGSSMGVNDGIKLLREYENLDVSETALRLAREVIKLEEENLERAKKYI